MFAFLVFATYRGKDNVDENETHRRSTESTQERK